MQSSSDDQDQSTATEELVRAACLDLLSQSDPEATEAVVEAIKKAVTEVQNKSKKYLATFGECQGLHYQHDQKHYRVHAVAPKDALA